MDFTSLKEKWNQFAKQATDKAKEIGNRALEFAGDNLAKTPLFIQDSEWYAKITKEKRAVILVFDEKNSIEKEIMMMLPIWQTQAFIDSASFRYMNNEKSDILIVEHQYTLPLEMRVFFEGKETLRLNSLDDIKKWWQNSDRDYTGEKTQKNENIPQENPLPANDENSITSSISEK